MVTPSGTYAALPVLFLGLLGILSLMPAAMAGHPCAHILVCCRNCNDGVTFLVNGEWKSDHDYGDIEQARGVLQTIKDAGIRTVIVDMTNPSQWTRFRSGSMSILENIRQVCREKEMRFFFFIGSQLPEEIRVRNEIDGDAFTFWNGIAKEIWETWAPDPVYRKYGYGDDRPMLLVFQPSEDYWPQYERAAAEKKTYLARFRIGTTQVNERATPGASDGWGYRSKWQNDHGTVRLASPNGSVEPVTWYHITADEWERQVRWANEAEEYSVYGSYDDTCDSFFWGIANTSRTERKSNVYPDPDNPRYYYDIVKRVLTSDARDDRTD